MIGRNNSAKGKGGVCTTPFFVLSTLSLVGLFFIGVRFTKGIGAVSNLSDGYPWGIWVAYDVGIGTAVACGRNRGEYHTLVKSAALTTLLGSFLAAFSVLVDIGRPWNAYGFFIPTRWQPNSALFELTLCIAAYTVALCIEYLPLILAAMERGGPTSMRRQLLNFLVRRRLVLPVSGEGLSRTASSSLLRVRINQLLICLMVAGIVLPTVHQSALGSLMLIASTKLHPLWHSPFLPMLFLINCIYIGYAIVILESVVSSFVLSRDYQSAELSALGRLIPWLTCAWIVIRVGDLLHRGQLQAVFHGDFYSDFFLAECFLMAIGSAPLFGSEKRRSPRRLFISCALMLLGGGLYRFNVYLIGFNPGTGWHYFPSFAEVMISVGIVAIEILAYQLLIKFLPLLPARSA